MSTIASVAQALRTFPRPIARAEATAQGVWTPGSRGLLDPLQQDL